MESEIIIEIKGEAVHLVRRQIERTVALQDWIAALQTRESTSCILPKGCRLVQNKADGTRIYLVECEPAVRTIEWNRMEGCEVTEEEGEYDGDWHNEEGQHYKLTANRWRLAFPYVVFAVKVASGGAIDKGGYIFYRTAPLSAMTDQLYVPNLGNLYGNLSICTGDMRLEPDLEGDAAKVDDYVGKFWASPFNTDLNAYFHHYRCLYERVSCLSAWRDASAANPLFMLSITWQSYRTLENFLEEGIREE